MKHLNSRVTRLEHLCKGISERCSVVNCEYPLSGDGPYVARVGSQWREFASEEAMLDFVENRQIGLYSPPMLSEAEWEAVAAAAQN